MIEHISLPYPALDFGPSRSVLSTLCGKELQFYEKMPWIESETFYMHNALLWNKNPILGLFPPFPFILTTALSEGVPGPKPVFQH